MELPRFTRAMPHLCFNLQTDSKRELCRSGWGPAAIAKASLTGINDSSLGTVITSATNQSLTWSLSAYPIGDVTVVFPNDL
jgi:hypothetical protein